MDDLETPATHRLGHDLGLAVDAPRDAVQAVRSVIDRIEPGDDRQQNLRRADVAGRLLAADMLLAGLQCHAQGLASFGVDRHADDAAGGAALIRLAGGEEGSMRPAIAHRHAETLCGTDDDIRAVFARRLQHDQGHQVAGDDGKAAFLLDRADRFRNVADTAGRAGVLQQSAENVGPFQVGVRIAFDNVEAQRPGARLNDRQRLRMYVMIDEESVGFRFRNPVRHGHGLGRRRAFVQQ